MKAKVAALKGDSKTLQKTLLSLRAKKRENYRYRDSWAIALEKAIKKRSKELKGVIEKSPNNKFDSTIIISQFWVHQ